jgi:hypothetical protein
MKLRDEMWKLYGNERWLQRILLAFMVFYYGAILHETAVQSPVHSPLDRTFNSMLDHLSHGQFDVDPTIIGGEGFLRNGHVYAYWGITCALVRLPLLVFRRLDLDVTVWSCLIAVCLMGMTKVRTVLFLRRYSGPAPACEGVFVLMLSYIVLGGAEVGYLKSSIYQEVIFWAIAFAAVFVYFAVKGLVSGQFTAVMLSWMATAAGLAALTRASTGVGLCVAFGLLLLVLLVKELRARRPVLTRRFFLPTAILAALLIVVGTVNYFRWGNPATFADYQFFLGYHQLPDQMQRMQTYGNFNLSRLPFGLNYYFLPLWALRGANGQLLFENTQTRLLNAAELPPSSFFLTDLLPIAFIVLLAMDLWAARPVFSTSTQNGVVFLRRTILPMRSPTFSYTQGLALATGLAMPGVLMLTAIYMAYRYRMEFYPEIDLLAFLGIYVTVSNPALTVRFNRCRRWMLAATIISIVSASAAMVLYWFSDWGLSQRYLRSGVVHYYLHNGSYYLQNLRFFRWLLQWSH